MTANSRHLSPAKKAWITRKIKGGKSKYQTAKELGISQKAVYRIAKNLPSKPCGWPGIRGKTLEILQELVVKGYHICSHECSNRRYFQLKKNFPTLYRAKMNRLTMYYLDGHENAAAKVFLGNMGKKIISYQALTNITDVFHANLSKSEKQAFLSRNQLKRNQRSTGKNDDSLGENNDSLAFFYIRRYCGQP